MKPGSSKTVPELIRVLRLEAQAISNLASQLGRNRALAKNYRKAMDLSEGGLNHGGKIVIMGIGKSGKVGQKISATLASTGSPSVFIHPTEGAHGDLGLISKSDVVWALSHSGNTDELMRLLPSLRKLKVPIIGIGGNPKSKLATASTVFLHAPVTKEACPYDLAPTTSTTLALAIGDALAVTLMQRRGFKKQDFAETHPAGSLGRRLTIKVQDLMHTGSAVPTVSAQASIDEIVIASTEKKLGAVLVVRGKALLGIITDGDLRRSLKHREKFFKLRASDIMTPNPVTARPEMLAAEALKLMENRRSQISVLPVVHARHKWVGLIRLHDLVGKL